MSIQQLVDEAFRTRILTREMQAKLVRLLSDDLEMSRSDYEAIRRLRRALLDGAIRAVTRPQFRNVMEELVWEEVETTAESREGVASHFHEIVAYALNRLPPLYATTEVGADYQRVRAREDLRRMISLRVSEAMEQTRLQPEWHPERASVRNGTAGGVLDQMGDLLQEYAGEYEAPTAG